MNEFEGKKPYQNKCVEDFIIAEQKLIFCNDCTSCSRFACPVWRAAKRQYDISCGYKAERKEYHR